MIIACFVISPPRGSFSLCLAYNGLLLLLSDLWGAVSEYTEALEKAVGAGAEGRCSKALRELHDRLGLPGRALRLRLRV